MNYVSMIIIFWQHPELKLQPTEKYISLLGNLFFCFMPDQLPLHTQSQPRTIAYTTYDCTAAQCAINIAGKALCALTVSLMVMFDFSFSRFN